MLLLHRITPFLFSFVVFIGLGCLIFFRIHPLLVIPLLLLLCGFLLARLFEFQFSSIQNRFFFGTPLLFLISVFGFLLFLESSLFQWMLAGFSTLMLFFFVEHLFHYIHLPARYQAYTLEHLSLVIDILTVYFISSAGFGLRMFLHIPLWMIALVFTVCAFFVILNMLWVSKVETEMAKPYAIAGAILAMEIFVVISFLPTGFYVNAAILAIFFYLFLGLTRAHFLDALTHRLVRHYLLIASLLFFLVVGTAQWL
ncbi:hypothetical protein A2332_01120 [Candidatus Uhrbacteria bacterium RIFOXYB2_FULL_41_18]|nr:MAG: hypothetical protein UT94_C0047G0004 [Candidatus Uhrbacteria bacterium GW2011_GWF2_40_263]OGL97304.1 MAG: hypothetical protein A2332_01120 [Candidatus Uhrbacteria bacterium RIFOXYB2_FULL_41_18]